MSDLKSPAAGRSATSGKRGTSVPAKTAAKITPAAHVRAGRLLADLGTVRAVPKRTPGFGPAERSTPALSCISVFRASPLERIAMIRHGVLASDAKRIFADLPIGQGAGFKALNLSTATVNKKAKQGDTLSPEESERIVGFAKLVGQLEAMIQESGDPANFNARPWMARWLTERGRYDPRCGLG